MSLSADALLSPEVRAAIAADPTLGGGNFLRAAVAANPRPDVPFLFSARPQIDTDGSARHEFSLLDIDRLAQSWSVWYLEQGVGPRDRVAIFVADSFAYSLHFYALSQIGAIPVMINSHSPQASALALCQRTAPIGLYTDQTRLDRLGEAVNDVGGLRWIRTAEQVPAPPDRSLPDEARYRHVGEDPVIIVHSSGTTGLPKPVTHTHASTMAGPRYRLTHFTESATSLMLTAQPQSHVGATGYGIYAVLAGTPFVALFDPTGPELVDAVVTYRPSMVLAFAHAYSDLAALDIPTGALDPVDGWVSMADAVHETHMRAVLGQRSPGLPGATFYDRFGSSELGWGLMVQQRTLATPRGSRRMGVPDPLAEFAVLRTDGTLADANEIGLFGVKSPTITVGYWSDCDTTYRSRLAGYWLSGDVGYRDDNGILYQVDRAVDVIATAAGSGYSVLMEELLLAEVNQIIDVAVVAGRHGDTTVAVATVSVSEEASPQQLLTAANRALRGAGQPELAVLEVVTADADVPLGVTGKVLKRQLRERYGVLSDYLRRCDGGRVAAVSFDLVH